MILASRVLQVSTQATESQFGRTVAAKCACVMRTATAMSEMIWNSTQPGRRGGGIASERGKRFG